MYSENVSTDTSAVFSLGLILMVLVNPVQVHLYCSDFIETFNISFFIV